MREIRLSDYLRYLAGKGQKTVMLHIVYNNRSGQGAHVEYATDKKSAMTFGQIDYCDYFGEKVKLTTNMPEWRLSGLDFVIVNTIKSIDDLAIRELQ